MTFQSPTTSGDKALSGGGAALHTIPLRRRAGRTTALTPHTANQPHASHSSHAGPEQTNTPRTASHHAVFLSQHAPGIDSGQHATSHHTPGLATPRPLCTPNSWLLKQVATSHNLPAPLTTTFYHLIVVHYE